MPELCSPAQSVLMVKSRRMENSEGAQQTFARSSPRLPGAEYKLLLSYPLRLHLQTWYLLARCTVCFRFQFLAVISCISLEERTRSALGQNWNCPGAHKPGVLPPALVCHSTLGYAPAWCDHLGIIFCPSLLQVWPSFVPG